MWRTWTSYPPARARRDPRDRRQRQHLGAVLLGEVQVVLDQGVLGVVAAAGHALAAVAARVAIGALAAEVRVRYDRRTALPRARRRRRRPASAGRSPPRPSASATCAHHLVGRRVQRVGRDAEHPLGLVVVRRQLGAPVGDVAPRRVVVERGQRLVERVGVDQRPAADSGAGQDQAVLERRRCAGCRSSRPRAGTGTAWCPTTWPRSRRRRTARPPRARRPGSPSRSAAAR